MNIYRLIKEQFNISNMDFSNKKLKNGNIFNKNIDIPREVYDKIMNDEEVPDAYIEMLNPLVSKMKPENGYDIYKICIYYSEHCPEASLNWVDVSEIIDMSFLFYELNYNGDISEWDVSKVESMNGMFMQSDFNHDISRWDVSNVGTMDAMFMMSKFNQDISGWDVSFVTSMKQMFCKSYFNQDISGWDVSNVIKFDDIFFRCPIQYIYKPEKFR